jgi:hypothetical protein
MTKTPAQGPYEVVTVIDEEGKARGKNGEQWLLIRNEEGAIASVYPGREAVATARLLAASYTMLEALKLYQQTYDNADRHPSSIDESNVINAVAAAILEAEGPR